MKRMYEHELTTGVPPNFPTALLEDVREAADDDRVIIDREDNVVTVAAEDDSAIRWLADWLELATGYYEDDAAQQLRDAVEVTFLGGDEGTVNKDQK